MPTQETISESSEFLARRMGLRRCGKRLMHDPNDVGTCTAELIDRDVDVEVLVDRIDVYSPVVWVRAETLTELDEIPFFDWLQAVVEPFNGQVLQAGRADLPPAA